MLGRDTFLELIFHLILDNDDNCFISVYYNSCSCFL